MPSSVHDFNCFLVKSRSSGPERVSKVHVVWSVRDCVTRKKKHFAQQWLHPHVQFPRPDFPCLNGK